MARPLARASGQFQATYGKTKHGETTLGVITAPQSTVGLWMTEHVTQNAPARLAGPAKALGAKAAVAGAMASGTVGLTGPAGPETQRSRGM